MKCIVIQTAFLGDVVLTVPLLDMLRGIPGVEHLVVVATPSGAEFIAGQGVAHEVVEYDKRGRDRGVRGFLRTVRRLKVLGPDLAVVPHRSVRSGLLAASSGAPERVGFDESGGSLFLSRRVRYRARPHEVERLADLAVAVGAPPPVGRVGFQVRVPSEGSREVDNLLTARGLASEDGLVVLAPGSRWPTKRWPAERFGEVAAALSRDLGFAPVVTGAGDEREAGRAAAGAAGPSAVDLTGQLSLAGWVGLIARASVVISNDSASAHVAAGVGTPVVAVFGPTVPAQGFAPYADLSVVVESPVRCRPCGRHGAERCRLGTLACMEAVGTTAVVDAARSILGREGTA